MKDLQNIILPYTKVKQQPKNKIKVKSPQFGLKMLDSF